MINRSTGRSRPIQREASNKPQYVAPTETLSAPLMSCKICVYTSSFKNEKGVDTLSFQTLDLGFVCRVSTVYPPDEDGYITYDPLHTLLNTKGSVPVLYILKSDRIGKIKQLESEGVVPDEPEDFSFSSEELGVTEEDLPF